METSPFGTGKQSNLSSLVGWCRAVHDREPAMRTNLLRVVAGLVAGAIVILAVPRDGAADLIISKTASRFTAPSGKRTISFLTARARRPSPSIKATTWMTAHAGFCSAWHWSRRKV